VEIPVPSLGTAEGSATRFSPLLLTPEADPRGQAPAGAARSPRPRRLDDPQRSLPTRSVILSPREAPSGCTLGSRTQGRGNASHTAAPGTPRPSRLPSVRPYNGFTALPERLLPPRRSAPAS